MHPTIETVTIQVRDVLEELCSRREVWAIDAKTMSVSCGFLLPDGDEYPISLELSDAGWTITDRGTLMGRFAMLDVSASEATDSAIRSVVEGVGCAMTEDWILKKSFGERFTIDDLTSFVEAIARVQAIADLPSREPSGPQFPRTVRDSLRRIIPSNIEIDDHWTDPIFDQDRSYPVDLRIAAPTENLYVWTVSGFDKADTPIVCKNFLQEHVTATWQAVAIVNRARMPRSPEMNRLQLGFGESNVLVAESSDEPALLGLLRRKGVPTA